ncbi:MAG: hypothetical protein KF806_16195, partial [Nitrospira sp.]|nr:hypothetical protein [Nitrospira sp.]
RQPDDSTFHTHDDPFLVNTRLLRTRRALARVIPAARTGRRRILRVPDRRGPLPPRCSMAFHIAAARMQEDRHRDG